MGSRHTANNMTTEYNLTAMFAATMQAFAVEENSMIHDSINTAVKSKFKSFASSPAQQTRTPTNTNDNN